jgi:hypothetical protein
LSLVSWAQCLHYASNYRAWTAALIAAATGLVCAGVETALILTLQPIYRRGIEWPMLVIGIVASILLAVGLIPPYFEIFKRKGQVIGIGMTHLLPSPPPPRTTISGRVDVNKRLCILID